MAIDYSGAGQSRGGTVGQGLGQGFAQIAAQLPSPEERTQQAFSKYFNTLDMSMNPIFEVSADGTMSYKGVANKSGNFGDNFKVKTLTEAWNDYVQNLNNKGVKLRPDEYSLFSEMYRAKSSEWGINLANKFERMQNAGLSKSKVRQMIAGNPELLQNLSKVSAISPESYASFQEYVMPGRGIIPSAISNIGNLAGALSPMGIPAAYRGYEAFKAAKEGKGMAAARSAAAKRMVPGATALKTVINRGLGKGKGLAEAIRSVEGDVKKGQLKSGEYKRWGTKSNIKAQKAADKALTSSEKSLKNATKAVDKTKEGLRKQWTAADKAWKLKQKNPNAKFSKTGGKKGTFKYKGKTYKTAAELTKQAAAADASLDKAKKAVESAKNKLKTSFKPTSSVKQQLKTIANYSKRHGTSKLMMEVAKRLGPKGLLKLGGRAGLSLLGKGAGLFTGGATAALSLGLDAWTVHSVYKIVKDIAAESGGIRRPDKMLFGAGESSGARGASY